MKILQVLTFVGPGNPFGGPARVAANQADELRRRGHEVVVAAAQPRPAVRGSWKPAGILAFDSRPVLRNAGFSGIVSVGLCRHLWGHAREYDIVHVHMSRDLVTMPAAIIARFRRVPYVLQTHGMIDPSHRMLARVLDAIATRRILGAAACVFVLTSREMNELGSLMGGKHFVCELLQNGINTDSRPPSAEPRAPEVLYCSRLHERKRPRAFVRAALDLLGEGVDARFVLTGPDEGELMPVEELLDGAGQPDGIVVEPPLEPEEVANRLARCSFMVLPSVDEPFPMIVLESLAVGRAVVITESCGLADFVRDNSCGVVVKPDDQSSLTAALRLMIFDPESTREMGRRGVRAIEQHLGIERVVDQLVAAYTRAGDTAS